MIYFFDNDLQLQKVVTSKNVISSLHEHEMNGIIINNSEFSLDYANKFLVIGISYFGYYYKDNFYIHKIKRVDYNFDDEVVTITGRHIFFEDMLYGDYIRDVRPVNRDALYILNQTISVNTRWQTVMTDTSKLHTTNYYWVPPMEVLNDLTENLGIEYEPEILFDGQKINGYQLKVSNRLGEDKPKRINFDSRVLNLKYEVDYSEIVTALYGHGKGEEVGNGYGRRINFSSVNFSRNGVVSPTGQLYMENPNVTAQYGKDDGSPKFGRIIFEDIESVSELADATYEAYLEQSRPKMLFEASVVDLGDVNMGDGILIISRGHDIYFNARINKVMIDLLNPKDADVELGDYSHFKESKVQRKTRENNNQYKRETSSRIQQLKNQFDERFDGEVNQMQEEFEQALIDAHAEIESAEVRMTAKINAERDTMMDEFNGKVQEARSYAEQQAQEKADTVQSNLEEATSTHQALIDGLKDDVVNFDDFMGEINQDIENVFGNIGNINDFIGDTTVTLTERMNDLRNTFGTDLENVRSDLQGKLDGVESELGTVESDLETAKDGLQAQLDEAGSSITTANNKISAVEVRITNAEGKLVTNNQNIADAQERLTQAEQDISKHGTDIGTVQQTLTNIDGELASKVERTEYDALEGTVSEHGTLITQNAEEILSKADQSFVDTLNNTVSDHTTLITQNATDISSKAESSVVDSLDGIVSDHSTLISQNAGKIESKADSSLVDSINGTVSEHSTLISQNAQEIESKAEQSIVDTLSGTVSDHESRITQNAKGIESKVSSEELRAEIDGIEVGGRNWFAKSKVILSRNLQYDDQLDLYYNVQTNNSFSIFRMDSLGLELNQKYILAYEIKSNNPELELRTNTYINGRVSSVDNNSPELIEGEWVKVYTEPFLYHTETTASVHIYFNQLENSRDFEIRNIQINRGTILQDYQEAPEDTEAKITDINTILTTHDTTITQNAEAIISKADKSVVDTLTGTVGEHSTTIMQTAEELKRKAESSVVDAINRTVENHTLTITETADNVSSLIEKTELHDDDITKWSNLTESTAEGLSQSITRISNVEGDVNSVSNDLIETAEEVTRTISRLGTVEGSLSSAETQIEANADGLSALTRRAIENEGLISDMQTEISTNASAIELRATKTELNTTNTRLNVAESKLTIEADWIGSLVSEVDDTSTRVSTIDQTVDSITQTVGEHDDWFGTHGSEVEQTVEGFNQKVWLSDVAEIGANLIPTSANAWEDGAFWSSGSNNNNSRGIRTTDYIDVVPGERYTFQDESLYVSAILEAQIVQWDDDERIGITDFVNRGQQRSFIAQGNRIKIGLSPLSGFGIATRYIEHIDDRIKIKLEKGSATPMLNAISHIEQLANHINFRVLEIDSGTVTRSEFSVQAGRIDGLVEEVDSHGTLISQTADTISSKVWLNDVADIQPNLIPHSNFNYPNSIRQWSRVNGNATAVDNDGFYTVRHTNSESTIGMYSPYFNMVEGFEYTLSVLVKDNNYVNGNYHWTSLNGAATTWIGTPTRRTRIDGIIYKNEYTFVANGTGRTRVRIGAYVNSGYNLSIRIKEPKIERGSTSTPFLNAFSAIEQEADRIRLMVQGDGESGYLTQSDITLEPDQIRIGSQQIGGQDLASVISVSPRAIDMIAEEINFTGNVNVKGKIESIAMSAVNAEFANLFVNQVEAGVIEASHIEGLTARFEWLYTLNANMEKLVSQNVFTNAVDAISIEAVYANISSVRTRLLTAGVIEAKHLNVNYAMIDELFAYEGRISRLTSKTAFIRDIQAIEVTARQLNLNTLTNRMNQIEGGLMIKRPDGAVSVNNGVLRPTFNIGFIQPHWMGVGVRTSGNYFRTNETSYVSATGFSYEQSGRYLTITGKAEMRGDVAGASRNTIGAIRLYGYSGTNASTFVYIDSRNDNNGNNQDFNITINMGRPDYKVKHFYVQFYTANAQSSANFRINQAYQHG